MRPDDAAGKIIDRIMNLKTYVVEVKLPEEFEFNGVVPYDLIIKDGVAKLEIPAINSDEARQKAFAFFGV